MRRPYQSNDGPIAEGGVDTPAGEVWRCPSRCHATVPPVAARVRRMRHGRCAPEKGATLKGERDNGKSLPFLLRDPFVGPNLKQIERERAAIDHFVVECLDVELCS